MKKLVLLLGALALFGCGEKNESGAGAVEAADSSADSQETGNQTEESSADSEELVDNGIALPLSDADVERLLKEAIDIDSLEQRDDLLYHNNEPFSGWGKMMYDSGQVRGLFQLKDGMSGLMTAWHENGQKYKEETVRDGNGFQTTWHENGQKQREVIVSDGEVISDKWWNNKGEEVETANESVPAAKRPKNNTP